MTINFQSWAFGSLRTHFRNVSILLSIPWPHLKRSLYANWQHRFLNIQEYSSFIRCYWTPYYVTVPGTVEVKKQARSCLQGGHTSELRHWGSVWDLPDSWAGKPREGGDSWTHLSRRLSSSLTPRLHGWSWWVESRWSYMPPWLQRGQERNGEGAFKKLFKLWSDVNGLRARPRSLVSITWVFLRWWFIETGSLLEPHLVGKKKHV